MSDAIERSFLFADLAGFTAMTESHGAAAAASTAIRFAELTTSVLADGASIVKTIGDAVMVLAPTPAAAVQTAVALSKASAIEPRFPLVRMGIHHGPCVERSGDYFGATVNLAARVAAHARAGQILATTTVATALDRVSGVDVREAGLGHFKNVAAPIPLFEIVIVQGKRELETIDPVCRMRIDPATAVARIIHGGAPYYFCSESCAKTFLDAPSKHVKQP